MAKAKRVKTRYPGVYRVGDRYEWISRRSGMRGMADTLNEARDAKADADRRDPMTPTVARATFGEYALDWLAAYQGRTARGFSEGTRERYRQALELWAIPYFDRVRRRKFAEVRKPDVRAFIAWLASPDARRRAKVNDRALSPRTIQATLAPVKAMYADAEDDGLIPSNPAKVRINVQPPNVNPDDDANDRRAFTEDELASVLDASTDRHRLMFDTLAETGIRWGEACELRGADLKTTPNGPRLAVRRAYSDKGRDADGKRVGAVKYPKSDYGRRDIPLTPDLARRLWRLQRAPGELLFTAPNGGRMNYHNTWNRALRPALDGAGIGWPAGFHTFRHTCASRLFAAGRNIKQIQRWLGHHKASFTLDTYTHLIDGDVGDALSLPVVLGGNTGATSDAENTRNDDAAETTETVDLRAVR